MMLHGIIWFGLVFQKVKNQIVHARSSKSSFWEYQKFRLAAFKTRFCTKNLLFLHLSKAPGTFYFFWFVHPALHESTATKTEEAQFVGVFCMRIKRKICCGKWFMSNSVCDQHAIFCRWSPITFDFKEETAYREQDLSLATMSLHCWQNSLSTTQEVETAGQWTKSCCSWFGSQWAEKNRAVLKFRLVAVSIVAMHLTETLLMWAFKDRHDWRALEPNATILTVRSVSFFSVLTSFLSAISAGWCGRAKEDLIMSGVVLFNVGSFCLRTARNPDVTHQYFQRNLWQCKPSKWIKRVPVTSFFPDAPAMLCAQWRKNLVTDMQSTGKRFFDLKRFDMDLQKNDSRLQSQVVFHLARNFACDPGDWNMWLRCTCGRSHVSMQWGTQAQSSWAKSLGLDMFGFRICLIGVHANDRSLFSSILLNKLLCSLK